MAEHNKLGKIGENIAKTFLMKHGFSYLESNYRTRYGEIDLIAEKDGILRFIEVKSIKVFSFNYENIGISPEDNFTKIKETRVRLSAEVYMHHKNISQETRRQFDLACIYINPVTREGKVKYIQNV